MKSKILFVLALLFGLNFINAGLNKFFQYMPMPDNVPQALMDAFAAMSEIVWLLPLIALAEIVGGILVIFPRTRAVGSLVLFPILVGILLTHITIAPGGLPMAIVFFVLNAWFMIEDREKFRTLVE